MITLQQTVDIPADRHLTLDLPKTVPSGRTSVVLVFDTPAEAPAETPSATRVLARQFLSIEALKAEAARKAEERAAYIKATGKDPILELLDSLDGSAFAGVDGVAYQRMMRDEWTL